MLYANYVYVQCAYRLFNSSSNSAEKKMESDDDGNALNI